jgi:hypothetical protein
VPVARVQAPARGPVAPATSSALPRVARAAPTVRLTRGPDLPGGAALGGQLRERLEASLGVDLSDVRVHADTATARKIDRMGVRAMAYGHNIFLGTGISPGDVPVMAHEVAHVLQQQGGASAQGLGAAQAPLEQEANRVASAVGRGDSATVYGRTSGARAQFFGLEDVAGFVRERARSIPGYDLLGVILGRDPLTQQPIERNASNLIHGLVALVPGGQEMWANLQQAHVIERAYEWVTGELGRLNLTWPVIRGAIDQFIDSLGFTDFLNPGGVFERARGILGSIVGRIATFALSAARKLLELIFEGALALGGSAAQRVLALFRRIGATFTLIANDPVAFLRHLMAAVAGGFQQFGANILTHLRTAVFEWLFGALQGAGLQLPQRWDLRGILSIVLQVLGLTYPRMRVRLVRLLGETAVTVLEQSFEFLRVLVTEGVAAAWQKILEFAGNLTDMVVEGIKTWVRNTIVMQAITQIASMLNPVGAIIQAIIKIYNTVMFVIERLQQLMAFVESVVDSISNIAQGNISAAVSYVERTLARILPLVISFLARFVGLGGISDRIREVIQRIQAPIDRAIDRILEWIRTRAASLINRVTGRGAAAGAATASVPERRFDAGGHNHRLFAQPSAGRMTIFMASDDPSPVREFLARAQADPAIPASNKEAIPRARAQLDAMDAAATAVANPATTEADRTRLRQQLVDQESTLAGFIASILRAVPISQFDDRYRLEGLVGTYGGMPRQTSDRLTPDHQPQASILQYVAGKQVFSGRVIQEVVRGGHVSGGMCINLHHYRHVAGRTYGRGPNTSAVDAAISGAPDPDSKRTAAIGVLRSELNADAAQMDGVAGRTADPNVWRDIQELPLSPQDRTVLIQRIGAQIVRGQSTMRNQNLDRLKETG